MLAVEIACGPQEKDRVVAELYELGVTGILEKDSGLVAYLPAHADPRVIEERLAGLPLRIIFEPDQEWSLSWRECWRSFKVGERFFLAPEWCDEPTPPGRIRLVLRPGRACGTGLHPCTQLCLEFLESVVQPGHIVLDVGTGSGLLAVAAARLGAGRVIACDLAVEAVEEARRRFAQEAPDVLLYQGSLRSLRASFADIVIANISAAAAVQLAPEARRVSKTGAAAIISGFRARQRDRVRAALEAAGFTERESREREGWQALLCYTR